MMHGVIESSWDIWVWNEDEFKVGKGLKMVPVCCGLSGGVKKVERNQGVGGGRISINGARGSRKYRLDSCQGKG